MINCGMEDNHLLPRLNYRELNFAKDKIISDHLLNGGEALFRFFDKQQIDRLLYAETSCFNSNYYAGRCRMKERAYSRWDANRNKPFGQIVLSLIKMDHKIIKLVMTKQ